MACLGIVRASRKRRHASPEKKTAVGGYNAVVDGADRRAKCARRNGAFQETDDDEGTREERERIATEVSRRRLIVCNVIQAAKDYDLARKRMQCAHEKYWRAKATHRQLLQECGAVRIWTPRGAAYSYQHEVDEKVRVIVTDSGANLHYLEVRRRSYRIDAHSKCQLLTMYRNQLLTPTECIS